MSFDSAVNTRRPEAGVQAGAPSLSVDAATIRAVPSRVAAYRPAGDRSGATNASSRPSGDQAGENSSDGSLVTRRNVCEASSSTQMS